MKAFLRIMVMLHCDTTDVPWTIWFSIDIRSIRQYTLYKRTSYWNYISTYDTRIDWELTTILVENNLIFNNGGTMIKRI